jgi:hypothetical protein
VGRYTECAFWPDAIALSRFSTSGTNRGVEKRQAKGPVRLVMTLLREAAQQGLIEQAPRLPRGTIKEAKKLPAAPTLAEAEGIVEASSGWLRVALALGIYAGLRGTYRYLR